MNPFKRKSKNVLRRFIAGLLSVLILLPNTPLRADAANQGFSPAKITQIKIPSNLGTLEAVFSGKSDKTIVYIQDSHDSLEVQENIARLIDYLNANYGVQTVFEEGFEGPVPADEYFDFIKDPELKKKTAHFFMDHLRIGGAEYAYINRRYHPAHQNPDWDLIGVDSEKLHELSVEKYRRSALEREVIAEDLKVLESEIWQLLVRYFPKEVQDWIKSKNLFDRDQLSLVTYLKKMTAILHLPGGAKKYSNIQLLMDVKQHDSSLNRIKIKTMNAPELLSDLKNMEREVIKQNCRSERDKKILDDYFAIQLLKRLSEIKLSFAEYQGLKARLAQLNAKEIGEFIHLESGKPLVLSRRWEKSIRDAIQFYETAGERDDFFSKMLDQHWEKAKRKSTRDRQKIAVLVYGGFHQANLKKIIAAKGINLAVITPKMTQSSKRHQEYYQALMTSGLLPFEKGFNKKNAMAARNPSLFNLQPKRWGRFEVQEVYRVMAAHPDRDLGILDRLIAIQTNLDSSDSRPIAFEGGKTKSSVAGVGSSRRAEDRAAEEEVRHPERAFNVVAKGTVYNSENLLKYFYGLVQTQVELRQPFINEEGVEVREVWATVYRRDDRVIAIPGLYDYDPQTGKLIQRNVEEIEKRFGVKAVTYGELREMGFSVAENDPTEKLKIVLQSIEGHGRKFYLPLEMTVVLKKNGARLVYFGKMLKEEIPGFDKGDLLMEGNHLVYKGVGTYRPQSNGWVYLDETKSEEGVREYLKAQGASDEIQSKLLSKESEEYVGGLKENSGEYFDFTINGVLFGVERTSSNGYRISRQQEMGWVDVAEIHGKGSLENALAELGASKEMREEFLSPTSWRYVDHLEVWGEYYTFEVGGTWYGIDRNAPDSYRIFKQRPVEGPLPGPGIYWGLHYQPGVDAYYGTVEDWSERLAYEFQDIYARNEGVLGEISVDVMHLSGKNSVSTLINLGGVRSFALVESRSDSEELSDEEKTFVRKRIKTRRQAEALFLQAAKITRALLKSGMSYGFSAMQVLKDVDLKTFSQSDFGEFRHVEVGHLGRVQQQMLVRNMLVALFEILDALEDRFRRGLITVYLNQLFEGKHFDQVQFQNLLRLHHPEDRMKTAEYWAKIVYDEWLKHEPYHHKGAERDLAQLHALVDARVRGVPFDERHVVTLIRHLETVVRSGRQGIELRQKIAKGLMDVRLELANYYLTDDQLDRTAYILGELDDELLYRDLQADDRSQIKGKIQQLEREVVQKRGEDAVRSERFQRLARESQPEGEPIFGLESQHRIWSELQGMGIIQARSTLSSDNMERALPLLVSWGRRDASLLKHGISFVLAEDENYFYAMTAAHVAGRENLKSRQFGLEVNGKFAKADLIAFDQYDGEDLSGSRDFVIFKTKKIDFSVQGIQLHVLELAADDEPSIDRIPVCGFGFSLPRESAEKIRAFGFGYANDSNPLNRVIQVTDAFADGFSGSPLIDLKRGRVLGIVLEGTDPPARREFGSLSASAIRSWIRGLSGKKVTGFKAALFQTRSGAEEKHLMEKRNSVGSLGRSEIRNLGSGFGLENDERLIIREGNPLRLSSPVVFVIEKSSLDDLSPERYQELLEMVGINRSELRLVIPDALGVTDSDRIAEIAKIGKLSFGNFQTGYFDQIPIIGFSNMETDTRSAFLGRLDQKLAVQINRKTFAVNKPGAFGLGILYASQEKTFDQLAVSSTGFLYDASGYWSERIVQMEANYRVISSAA